MIKPAKLRFLQYRILTKTLTTNLLRSKWDVGISPLCSFCQLAPETTVHLLYSCEKVQHMWVMLVRWCKYFLKETIDFDLSTVILNNYIGKHKALVNTFIITLKQYIYSQKCMQESINFNQYIAKVSEWYQIEKIIAYRNNKVTYFDKKWAQIF